MVFYFTSEHDESYVIYVGKHKEENEELLKYGFPEDVWFHVDNFSSAHVYLRLKPGQTISDVPEEIIEDCSQIVKANSIAGCKEAAVHVILTPFPNLKKTRGMEDGQVGFHSEKKVIRRLCKRDKDAVRRLNKTKREAFPNLKKLRQDRDKEQQQLDKAEKQRLAKEEAKMRAQMKEKKKQLEYTGWGSGLDLSDDEDKGVEEYEESFM